MSRGKKSEPKPDHVQLTSAVNKVQEKTPLQLAMEARAQKFFDWENSTGPKDVTQAPGMDAMLDIYGSAERLANQKRFNPAQALAGPGAAGHAAQLAEQTRMNLYDERAKGLNQGLAQTRAEAYGLGDQAVSRELGQNQAYADLLMQKSRDYYNRPQKPSTWEKIAGFAIGGLGAAGSLGLKF
jgi:hypothetical protein